MAHGAGVDHAGMPLQRNGLNVVCFDHGGRNGVGAAMAGITEHAMVSLRVSVEGIRLLELEVARLRRSGMAIAATRFR